MSFTSIELEQVDGQGERAIVLCDRDRLDGIKDLIGRAANIDGRMFVVASVEDDISIARFRGQPITVWLMALDDSSA